MLKKNLIDKIFPEASKRIASGLCPSCSDPITKFRDDLSEKEFLISGLCQECQDSVFDEEEE